MLGGIIGNMIDRLRLHYVRDFVDVGPWPIFNIADSATVVGTIIFAISILFFTREFQDKPAKPSDSSATSTSSRNQIALSFHAN